MATYQVTVNDNTYPSEIILKFNDDGTFSGAYLKEVRVLAVQNGPTHIIRGEPVPKTLQEVKAIVQAAMA